MRGVLTLCNNRIGGSSLAPICCGYQIPVAMPEERLRSSRRRVGRVDRSQRYLGNTVSISESSSVGENPAILPTIQLKKAA